MVKRIIIVLWILLSPWLWNTLRTPLDLRFDPLWRFSEVEITQINFYRSAYSQNALSKFIGQLSLNKAVTMWGHAADRFFGYADPNFYFFGNHPRERVGEKEIQRLPSWSLVLFIIGFIQMIKDKSIKKWFVIFFCLNLIVSLSGLKSVWIELLFMPLMIFVLTTGTLYVLDKK